MTTTRGSATAPLPPPVARPEDAPLRQDVRWLAAALGRVVQRLEGDAAFRAVENTRRACRARRLGVADAPDLDTLLAQVRALPPDVAAVTVRAFTLFFILINATRPPSELTGDRCAGRYAACAKPDGQPQQWPAP